MREGKLAFGFAGSLAQNLIRVALNFEDALFRLLVLTQTEENRMAHPAVGRPLGELYLSHQLRFHPLNRLVGLGFVDEGAVFGFERLHQLVSLRQGLMIETSTGMRNILEFALAVEANDECTEVFA